MISAEQRINAFVGFSEFIKAEENAAALGEWAEAAYRKNNWFVPENVRYALNSIADMTADKAALTRWVESYPSVRQPSKIGLVLAGNIPAVGFHDILCVLISGHQLLVKPSSDDYVLIRLILDKLCEIEPGFRDSVHFVERINEADAYIATGSDNTARYFEYYFAAKPHIIRKNRVSVAVLNGSESGEQLSRLCSDIFLYFGLGCRNVSKLFVPAGYDFSGLYDQAESYRNYAANHHKYFNNYEYHKSILLVNREPHLDNGYLILRESDQLVSPLSVLYYKEYNGTDEVGALLQDNREKIQCVISDGKLAGSVPFGESQKPGLTDYADGVDVMEFLSKL
mgnify:CR=1 FL=1